MQEAYPWLSLVPPILAIVGAMLLRNVYLALGIAILAGNLILLKGDLINACSTTLSQQVVRQIAPEDGDVTHLLILLFTLGTGSAVELMRLTKGAEILITKLSRLVKTRIQAQFTTWLMGIIIFFDDYANTIIVGTVARPLTDRFKISREKLAYLIDTTSAPVAGLALISTWIGAELGYISGAYEAAKLTADPFGIFIATLPYRFYPWLALLFALVICLTGRDFGPMHQAELKANLAGGAAINQHANDNDSSLGLYTFMAILLTFISMVFIGIFNTGFSALAQSENPLTFTQCFELQGILKILGKCNSNLALLWGAFYSTLLGIVLLKLFHQFTLTEIFNAIFQGMSQMFPATCILILAWGIASICDKDHLQTADYLGTIVRGRIEVVWMPLVAYLLSCVVSLTTGSSWSTMGMLIPLIVPITTNMLTTDPNAAIDPYHPILINTVGAILAGSIFGDHCSPISDTTVLSSAAAQCDHLQHVNTQYPYAIVVGIICIAGGYLPLMQQVGIIYCWCICFALVLLSIFILGKKLKQE